NRCSTPCSKKLIAYCSRSDKLPACRPENLASWQLALRFSRLLKIPYTLLIRRDHIQQPITIHIGDLKLRPYTTVVIDLMGNPRRLAAASFQLKPKQHRRIARIDVSLRSMCPPSLAGDKVGQSVAIDIRHAQRVRLCEAVV